MAVLNSYFHQIYMSDEHFHFDNIHYITVCIESRKDSLFFFSDFIENEFCCQNECQLNV